ncbi:MAG TPA: hypothetical protein DIU37_02405 [Opitutae bacterium]|nr:hypothetical protein [Opitutae bacterium]
MKRLKQTLLMCLGLYTLHGTSTVALAESINIKSRFSPSHMSVGSSAAYRIEFQGIQSAPRVQLPKIPGLRFIPGETQRRVFVYNGNTRTQVTVGYRVDAQEVGEYTVPSFEVTIDGEPYTVPAASLSVLKADAPQGDNSDTAPPVKLELIIPKKKLYVGETIPCQVKLFVQAGVQSRLVSEEPSQEDDAFVVSASEDMPQSSIVQRGNVQYQEVTWTFTGAPIKAGEFPLKFEYLLEVIIPDDLGLKSFSPIGSYLSQFMYDIRQAKVDTGATPIEIIPLPREGRPENFTGAIGDFTVYSKLSADTVEVGEPVTLSLSISGKGNFDRIQAPGLNTQNLWKAYEPKRSFTPTDALGYRGVETVEYILIPKSASIEKTPIVRFTYFDPGSGTYKEAVAEPMPIQVTEALSGNNPISMAPAIVGASQEEDDNEPIRTPKEPGLVGIETEFPGRRGSLQPVIKRPYFWVLQGLIGVGLIGWITVRMRQIKMERNPLYARRVHSKKSVKKHFAAAQQAADKHDTLAFFVEAHKALQNALGTSSKERAETLTWQEIERLLHKHKASEKLLSEVKTFVEGVDAVRFGARKIQTSELSAWVDRLATLLSTLEELL